MKKVPNYRRVKKILRHSDSNSFRLKHVIPAISLFMILTAAGMSSIPPVAAITQYTLLVHTMCKNVTDEMVCQKETHAFDAEDEYAFVWFKIQMGETGQFGNKKAVWYYQNGVAEKTITWGTHDVEKGQTWTSSGRISIRDQYASWRGHWRIEIFGPQEELLFTDEFTIGPYYDARVEIQGFPETVSIPIKVDGENYGEIKREEVKKLGFAPGTSHKLTVQQEITGNEGVRWLTQENTWEFGEEGSHSFTYQQQYELRIVTDPIGAVSVTGAGWYSKGATASIGKIPETVEVTAGTRFMRKSIVIDNEEVTTPPATITIDNPHTIKLRYQKEHFMKVESNYGNPEGEGWYDERSSVTFSVTSPWPVEGFLGTLGGKYVFDHWSGDSSGTTATASVVMDGPKAVSAVWRTDNTMPYLMTGAIVAGVIIVVAALLLARRRRASAPVPTYGPPPAAAVPPSAPPVAPTLSPPAPSEARPAAGKFCISCGAPLPAHVTFCNKCGTKQ